MASKALGRCNTQPSVSGIATGGIVETRPRMIGVSVIKSTRFRFGPVTGGIDGELATVLKPIAAMAEHAVDLTPYAPRLSFSHMRAFLQYRVCNQRQSDRRRS